MPLQALVVDSNEENLAKLSNLFDDYDFCFDSVDSTRQAKEFVLTKCPEILLVDIDGEEGHSNKAELLEFLLNSSHNTATSVYFMSRSPTIEQALEALRVGARDLFEIPGNLERLAETLMHFCDAATNRSDDAQALPARTLLLGESPAMQRVYNVVRKVATSDVSVLLSGESGTGKELLARSIHELSPRSQFPFVAVNCGAIAAELAESELFGHVKGAFTGANKAHKGYFAQAAGGTLFLDEITEMKHDLQVKLLRVLESHSYQPVGAERSEKADVRIVASSNRDVEQAVTKGILRLDLFYRVAQFPLQIPPLRERGEDVALLAKAFLAEQCREHGVEKTFSPFALDLLRLQHWPGNVRELRNTVVRAFLLAKEEVTVADISDHLHPRNDFSDDALALSSGVTLEDVGKRVIFSTLEQYGGNKTKTASVLGISLKTLYNRLKRYNEDTADEGIADEGNVRNIRSV